MLSKLPIIGLSAALAGTVGGGLAYFSHERSKQQQMTALNESLSGSLIEMQHQVEALRHEVADMSAARTEPPAPEPAPRPAVHPVHLAVRPAARRQQAPAEDPRFKQMQAQLADTQQQLAGTQQQLAGTRDDLDKAKEELSGRLDSTRDELSTSIAKNHDELVELQKRGERNYYEFQLDKSKNFDRVGPLRLSLRKADAKHKNFNLAMMVDDNQLQKKNVNLYEPLRIDADGEGLELVVNQITKDHVQGYLSEPKYKKSGDRPTIANSEREP